MVRFPRVVRAVLQQPGLLVVLLLTLFRRHVTKQAVATARAELDDEHRRLEAQMAESRRVEAALRESEERWRTLLANSQEIVTLVNADGVLSYVSPSIERWLGHKPEDVIGADAASMLHPDDSGAFRATFAAAA